MAKNVKRVKKRKLNFLKVITFLLIIYFICHLIIFLSNIKIKNIIVNDTYYLTDEEIINEANLDNYPSFFRTSTINREKKLEENPLIYEAEIKRQWNFVYEINIKENKILYKRKSDNIYVLENGGEVSLDKNVSGVATLINYTPKDITKKFNKKLSKIKIDVLNKISEIEYAPNKTDDERFLFYMNDGNLVYITITNIDEIDYYIDIVKKLNGKKGVLNLDSGNYFEIME